MNARHPNAPAELEVRTPPNSVEAEQAILGALLIHNGALDLVADVLRESDFYLDSHRRIYRHIAALVMAGKPADVVTVADVIELAGETDQTGGLPYLAEIANATPSAANARGYANVVADRALRRALMTAAIEIEQSVHQSTGPALSVIDAAQARVMALAEDRLSAGDPEPIQPAITDVLNDLEEALARGEPICGMKTGFIDLDNKTNGLHPGNLVIIAGRPSMGKTALALNIAEHVAVQDGKVVLVFSMEMTRKELAVRNLASVGGVLLDNLRTGRLTDQDWERMTVALGKLHEARLIVDETGGLTLGRLRAKARRVMRKYGQLDLIVVDYMQLMEDDGGRQTRNDEITAISRGLKAVAKELHCPVIALSQLSRKVEERNNKRPIMSDLRESGAIEQDADVILMMYREEYYNHDTQDKGLAEVIIGKQRNGPTGDLRLGFEGEYSRFRNLAFGEHVREVARQDKRRGKGFEG